jgi:uncharacterized membrane protein (UPF0127 family)
MTNWRKPPLLPFRTLCAYRPAALALLFIAMGLAGCQKEAPGGPAVIIKGQRWNVELAITDAQKSLGLAGRKGLGQGDGMLFIYSQPEVLNYWMKDCYFSIDIAFVGPDHRIVQIHTMPAESDRAGQYTYSSQAPAQYALEVNAGQFARMGIKVGDKVEFAGHMPTAASAGQ